MSRRRPVKRSTADATARVPAITILLLVLLVVAGVSLLLAFGAEAGKAIPKVGAGFNAAFTAPKAEESGHSAAELAALSHPLPAGAVKVHAPILMYHYVDSEPPPAGPYADGLTVRTPDFVKELEYLADNGYHTVTLADVYLAMAGIQDLPAKPVALTFDDGGLDNYTVAFPLLKQYGFRATFFVITKRVGAIGQMDWAQLREMADAGMAIQSHTVSHPDLTTVSASRLKSELADSRTAIEQGTGQPGYVLCYPSGAHNAKVIQAAKAAGYVMAVATDEGISLDPSAPFEITRKRVQAFLPLSSYAKLVK